MNTITKHYIDGAFVESHGREVMEIINPTNRKVIAQVTLADEEDAVGAAKEAFAMYGRSTKEERARILRRLHEVVSARSTISPPRWLRSTVARPGSLAQLLRRPPTCSLRLKRRSKNCH
jgi:Aldehyde dehydrogenase family